MLVYGELLEATLNGSSGKRSRLRDMPVPFSQIDLQLDGRQFICVVDGEHPRIAGCGTSYKTVDECDGLLLSSSQRE